MGVLAGMFLSLYYSRLWLPGAIGSESPLPFYRLGGSIEMKKKNCAIRETCPLVPLAASRLTWLAGELSWQAGPRQKTESQQGQQRSQNPVSNH